VAFYCVEEREGRSARRTFTCFRLNGSDFPTGAVEVLYQVFKDRGAADNSFKKSTFEKAVVKVRHVYKGPHEITWLKCKNQWADLKAK